MYQIRPISKRTVTVGLVAGLVLVLTACAGGAQPARILAASDTTVTVAMQPGQGPDYIMPITPGQYFSFNNTAYFIPQMYPSLYWFGKGSTPDLDEQDSMAKPAVFTNGGKTVLLYLKKWKWSDGYPVTCRDIQFSINLMAGTPSSWGGYVPGYWPTNITSFQTINPYECSITFNRVYNKSWIQNTELAQIFPIPQHVWDRESANGSVGNYDLTTAGAQAVWNFLYGQATTLSTYTTNPLWKVVDGPYELESYAPTTNEALLKKNTSYSGPQKPQIDHLEFVPFTSDAAELNAVLSGQIDYGYLPFEDASLVAEMKKHNLVTNGWTAWEFNMIFINFGNTSSAGPILGQLYVRQAMAHLIDQQQYSKDIFKGYASPSYGPVPATPTSAFLTKAELHDPYPYSPSAAETLLSSHGWKKNSSGTFVCEHPGIGSGDCGAGISSGTVLALHFQYPSGQPTSTEMAEAMTSAFRSAGIYLTATQLPFGALEATLAPCDKTTGAGCSWQLVYASPLVWNPSYYPSGEVNFASSGGYNVGEYDNPTNDKNVLTSVESAGLGGMHAYELYLAKDLPDLWMPEIAWQISEINSRLKGVVPQPSTLNIRPQYWYFK